MCWKFNVESVIYLLVWLRLKAQSQNIPRSVSAPRWRPPRCCSCSCLHHSCDMSPCFHLRKYTSCFLLDKSCFFFCNHIQTAFLLSAALWLLTERDITSYHLFTCYVTNAGVGSDQISVWDFVSQLHPVTVTVEVLQVHKRKWRLRSSELLTRVQ